MFPLTVTRTPARPSLLLIVAGALLLAVSSCRLSPLAPTIDTAESAGIAVTREGNPPFTPSAAASDRCGPVVDEHALAPAITRLRGEVRQGTLYLTGQLETRRHHANAAYTPYQPGGWCLQVFLNTDRQSTGYWLGFDYIIRGVEWDPASRTSVVRRITLESGFPGGWGPESGKATIRVSGGSFAIAVPLRTIGGSDGSLDFALETYATVACPQCESGYSHEFAATYFGSSAADGRPLLAAGFRTGASGPVRPSPRPFGARSAAAYLISPGLTLVQ
jgi:hypothetical protein